MITGYYNEISLVKNYCIYFQNFLRAKFVICLTHNERGDLITGDSNGTIYVFGDGGNKITNFIKHAHDVSCENVTTTFNCRLKKKEFIRFGFLHDRTEKKLFCP